MKNIFIILILISFYFILGLHEEIETIQQGVNFALSQDVTGLCTAADVDILPKFLDACEKYEPMIVEQQEDLIARAGIFETIFDWENV